MPLIRCGCGVIIGLVIFNFLDLMVQKFDQNFRFSHDFLPYEGRSHNSCPVGKKTATSRLFFYSTIVLLN